MRRLLLALLWLVATPALAHEVRPAYLELHEDSAGEFAVLWKTPMRGDLRLSLTPVFSARTQVLTPITTRQAGGAAVQRWRIEALEPLRGRMLRIDGLEATMTDALVRAEFADGTNWTGRFTPHEPAAVIPVRASAWSVAVEYSKLGVEHILLGIDHLLFVLELLLFNVGVEIGQLLFLAAVLSLAVAIRRVPLRVPSGASRVLPYLIGSVATFWVFQRVAAF